MKAALIICGVSLWSGALHAQGTYTICDPQEFCICHDGSPATYTYVFYPCQIGWSVSAYFCSGDVPEGVLLTGYNGPNSASPSMGTLGYPGPWDGSYYVSTHPSGALMLYLTYAGSDLSCVAGDYEPLVFWAVANEQPTFPPVMDCNGNGCLSTGMMDFLSSNAPRVTYGEGGLHFTTGQFSGELEIRDLSDRVIEGLRAHGERHLPIRATLSTGMYVAVFRGATKSRSQLFVVP